LDQDFQELPASNGGQFGFMLTGPAGQPVLVETSTDLMSWLAIWATPVRTTGANPTKKCRAIKTSR